MKNLIEILREKINQPSSRRRVIAAASVVAIICSTVIIAGNYRNISGYISDPTLTTSTTSTTLAPGTRVFTKDGFDNLQTAADFDYVAKNYDLLITDGFNTYNSKVSYLKSLNPNLKVLAYINTTTLPNNSTEYKDFLVSHPDWFLKDRSGNPVYEKDFAFNILLNPANQDWVNYRATSLTDRFITTYKYDGIFLDVVNPWISERGYVYYNAIPINPVTGTEFTNAEWRAANLNLLKAIKAKLGSNLAIFNGLIVGDKYFRYNMQEFVNAADGVMMEGFVRWGYDPVTYNRSETDWKLDVDAIAAVAASGKLNMTWSETWDNVVTTEAQDRALGLYCYASYLLASKPSDYFDFRSKYNVTGSVEKLNPISQIKVGSPLSPYVKKDNVYQREYSNGLVLVNPNDIGATYAVTLPGTYIDPDGKEITSVTLAPKSGTILTKKPIITADTTLPTVSIASPLNASTISGTTTVTASASDNVGVSKVEMYVDGVLKATLTAGPYNYVLDTKALTNASHTILAKAYDSAGNSNTSSVSVTVSNTVTQAGTTTDTKTGSLTSRGTSTLSYSLPKTGQVIVDLTWNNNSNLDFEFLDNSGNIIGSAKTSAKPEKLTQSISVAGAYKVRVINNTSKKANYTLSVTYPN